jgi:hypothetical protein
MRLTEEAGKLIEMGTETAGWLKFRSTEDAGWLKRYELGKKDD